MPNIYFVVKHSKWTHLQSAGIKWHIWGTQHPRFLLWKLFWSFRGARVGRTKPGLAYRWWRLLNGGFSFRGHSWRKQKGSKRVRMVTSAAAAAAVRWSFFFFLFFFRLKDPATQRRRDVAGWRCLSLSGTGRGVRKRRIGGKACQ